MEVSCSCAPSEALSLPEREKKWYSEMNSEVNGAVAEKTVDHFRVVYYRTSFMSKDHEDFKDCERVLVAKDVW